MTCRRPSLSPLFEGDFAAMASQLTRLSPGAETASPARLELFRRLLSGPCGLAELEPFYSDFLSNDDHEAAAACVGLAVAAGIDSGSELGRLGIWQERIPGLLARKAVTPAARAFLLMHQALVEVYGQGDLSKADATCKKQRLAAEKASSAALQLMGATWHAYCFTWSGDLARSEIILEDAASLVSTAPIAPPVLCQFLATRGLISSLYGRTQDGLRFLNEAIGHPAFAALPPQVQLLPLMHLLETHIIAGNPAEVEHLGERVRDLAIPAGNDFLRSYLHFALGMAALNLGRPHKALLHCDEADLRARQSQSPIAVRMNALLRGFSLSDLGRHQEALAHLEEWIERWQACGFYLIAALGCLEISALQAASGKFDKARQAWHQAHALIPAGEKMPSLYRPQNYYSGLAARLFPPENGQAPLVEEYPVQITTLGGFCLKIGQRLIYDRDWHGRQSRNLLFALIVQGGLRVPKEQLADLLWPDSDGDLAANSLNVTVTRLRRVGGEPGHKPLPWLVVKNRCISLAGSLCRVDVLDFQTRITEILQRLEPAPALAEVLNTYTGTFLPNITEFLWINTFRGDLERLYVHGVLRLVDGLLADQQPQAARRLLEQAGGHAPLNEEIWARRLRICLDAGENAMALVLYHQAMVALEAAFGVEPGTRLQELAMAAGHGRIPLP